MLCKCGKQVKAKGLCSGCYSAEWRNNNPEHYRRLQQNWYKNNIEHSINYAKQWMKDHPEKANATTRRWVKKTNYYTKRYHTDIQFNLKTKLRRRLKTALKGNYKTGSAVRDLGCSIDEFKIYLESKFIDGMTWDNMGEWHIDHIYPLSRFDLNEREQFLKACHYTNLQPLWWQDNIYKKAKV